MADEQESAYEVVSTTVAELMEQLSKLPPDARVHLSVGNPKDTAYTDEITGVRFEDGVCTIDGWVASENENAFMPGYED